AIRGDRRIDASREKARHASGGAGRQTARAALLAEEIERLVGQHFHVDDELRMREIDAPAFRVLDASADFALDLRRRQREALVGAPRRHAKAVARAIAEVAQDGGGDPVDIERRAAGMGIVRDAEGRTNAIADDAWIRGWTEHDLDSAHEVPNRRHVE